MTDHFQLTSVIAAAIRECQQETPGPNDAPHQPDSINMEAANCIAKAVLVAIADAGYEISPKQAG